jgi:hypothetical protein
MELKLRPYPNLLKQMKEHFTKEENAEMVAILTAAEYEHTTLLAICGSKMFSQLPAIASETITTVDMIAEKVSKNWSSDEQNAN